MDGTGDGAAATVVVVAADGSETVVGRIPGPDLAVVEAVLRLHRTVRRDGGRVVLRDVADDLRRFLDLVGLAEVLAATPASSVSARGERGARTARRAPATGSGADP